MKFKTSIFLLFVIVFASINAQNSIKGTIVDNKKIPLQDANIVLYKVGDKKPITGVISNGFGAYELTNIIDGEYLVEVSVLGFATKKSDAFKLAKTNKELNFTLEEETQTLNEVVVKSTRPTIKRTAEKLIVNLENSEMVNSNLQDVMKRVPGIIVTSSGITYAGQSNIRILINGKTTDYMDVSSLLRDFPAENISKIELIEQPGAEFDAAGSGPIINIILKRNVKLGTNGNVKAWIGEDQGIEHGTSAAIASYKNKLNWQLGAGVSNPTWREDLYIKREVVDPTTNEVTIYDQVTMEPYKPKTVSLNAGVDYYINENNTVGVKVNRIKNMSDRTSTSTTKISNSTATNALLTKNAFDRNRTTFNINPYYEFKNDAHKITADFNFVDYKNDNINTISEVPGSTIPYTSQRYLQDAKYQIKAYKLDYKRTFTDNFTLSFGSKYAQVNTTSDLQSFSKNLTNGFDFIASESNTFLIDENIFALYSKVNFTANKWSFSGGLRFEDSNTTGVSTTTNEEKERVISKLFPSASISKEINESISASLSYSYRINRPSYNTLNSFITNYDPLSSDKGNENLKPSFTNKIQFNLTYDGQPFFTIGYSETKDALFQFITQDDATAQITRTTINLAENKNWNFRAFAPLTFMEGLNGFTGFIVNHNQFKSEELTAKLDLSKWSLIWYTQVEYALPWDINAELSGQYGTGTLQGQIEFDWFAGLDFAMSKKFMDGRLKTNLGVRNILNRQYVGTLNYDNISADIISDESRQNVYLQLAYNFGSQFGKKKQKRNSSRDEENRINDNN